jgi:hypothetical protein
LAVLGLPIGIASMAAAASAGVLYDGSGDPTAVGFTYAGDPVANVYTFDSQGGPAGSSPGYLFQQTTSSSGSFRLGSVTEFDRDAGWTVEARLRLNTNLTASGATGEGFGMFVTLGDEHRGYLFSINPSRVTSYYNGAPGSQDAFRDDNEWDVDMRQFHILKWVQPAGGGAGSLQFYVDGALTDINTGDQVGTGPGSFTDSTYQQEFQFFNNGGPGGTAGTWDYIAINTAAPAIPLAEIQVHTPVNATVIEGGTGTLGFSTTNSAAPGSQNLTVTSMTPEALAGTTYGAVGNPATNLPPQTNNGNSPFTATTTSGVTPAGAHTLNVTIEGNATNSPHASPDEVSPVLTVLNHSNGSLDNDTDQNSVTIDFGQVPQGTGSISGQYEAISQAIYNLVNTPDFTARLELYPENVSAVGDTSVLFLFDDNTTIEFYGLGAGGSTAVSAVLDTDAPLGAYSSTWTLLVEDHNAFNGHVNNAIPLTLTLVAEIVPVPEPASLTLVVGAFGMLIGRRRRA